MKKKTCKFKKVTWTWSAAEGTFRGYSRREKGNQGQTGRKSKWAKKEARTDTFTEIKVFYTQVE